MRLREGKVPAQIHTARMQQQGVQTQILQPKERLSNKATHAAAPDPSPCAAQPRWGKEAGWGRAGRSCWGRVGTAGARLFKTGSLGRSCF